ncbi:MAG: YqcI/YcgG family protein [Acidobacteria bacterium]|nr:YqcI/YcgG family protein [Acidobacteriota bacterium]MCA1609788.1 YqcI/YcgG family protein [Acidobacteriota bacterium]
MSTVNGQVSPRVVRIRSAKGLSRAAVEMADAAFRDFVEDPRFSCLAGKGVVRQNGYRIGVYGRLGAPEASSALSEDLASFSSEDADDPSGFSAFVAIFPDTPAGSESDFETRLWQQLQGLHELDDPESGWDPRVSDDPGNPHFSFSYAGRAYFVVGLHPQSSRLARRFRWPALVFNPHAQFERLRASGHFERLQHAIRDREMALQGSLNPNLADFGERSEARQYSGRATESEWRCPFSKKSG